MKVYVLETEGDSNEWYITGIHSSLAGAQQSAQAEAEYHAEDEPPEEKLTWVECSDRHNFDSVPGGYGITEFELKP